MMVGGWADGCWLFGSRDSRDPKWCSDEVEPFGDGCEDMEEDVDPGEAKPPSEPMSEGAGVTGGVSMVGMGWSLKHADS